MIKSEYFYLLGETFLLRNCDLMQVFIDKDHVDFGIFLRSERSAADHNFYILRHGLKLYFIIRDNQNLSEECHNSPNNTQVLLISPIDFLFPYIKN